MPPRGIPRGEGRKPAAERRAALRKAAWASGRSWAGTVPVPRERGSGRRAAPRQDHNAGWTRDTVTETCDEGLLSHYPASCAGSRPAAAIRLRGLAPIGLRRRPSFAHARRFADPSDRRGVDAARPPHTTGALPYRPCHPTHASGSCASAEALSRWHRRGADPARPPSRGHSSRVGRRRRRPSCRRPPPSTLYDLYAVVCHVGSAERGHYTAYARSSGGAGPGGILSAPETGGVGATGGTAAAPGWAWFSYDDAVAARAREEDVASDRMASLVYLLFYAKRMPGAPPPPMPPPPPPPPPPMPAAPPAPAPAPAGAARSAADAEAERTAAADAAAHAEAAAQRNLAMSALAAALA
jgi:hypothetical protein